MEALTKLFEPYDRKARLYPAMLTLAPIFVLLLCRYGKKVTLGSGIVSLLIFCGALFWVARVARNAGVRVQDRMWTATGGKTPSVKYLRHCDTTTIDPVTRDRYHAVLSSGIGKAFPTASSEAADSASADHLYWSGIRWLMEQTRDTRKYSHLFKENIAYGFQRNMLGIKSVAVSIAVLCLVIALFWIGLISSAAPYIQFEGISEWQFEHVLSILLPAGLLCMWLFAVTEKTVNQASDAYSARLFQACEGLATSAKIKPVRAKKVKTGPSDV